MSARGSAPTKAEIAGGRRAIGSDALTLAELLALARGELRAELSQAPADRERLQRGRKVLESLEESGAAVYGVTTGVGASSGVAIPPSLREALPANLVRFHGCGTGRLLDETEAGAVVALRAATLARGYSGVRAELVEQLCALLRARVLPCIPEEGSVGASGDLTPLSYLAALVMGEREALYRGEILPAADALAKAGLTPLPLALKESLALMNGTAVMTAIACVAWERCARLAKLATGITALVVDATQGNPAHFDARIFALKPHPGQIQCAAWLREDLGVGSARARSAPARLQDPYSLRCAPHVIGVLLDALADAHRTLEIEIHSVDDNPLVDPVAGEVLHGGNFYGGHVCHAMDSLKACVASVADLLDRQLVLLCNPATNGGLPANLVASDNVSEHGFKAMQITASALAAEALKLTIPASAFSRSTESHNQDKVSMGTIAARDCRRVVELAETVAAIALLAGCQALDLRGGALAPARLVALRDAVRERVPMVASDRRQDRDIETALALIRGGALPLASVARE
jgi:histidine ammonia-lyase